jgi:hypothetical protein
LFERIQRHAYRVSVAAGQHAVRVRDINRVGAIDKFAAENRRIGRVVSRNLDVEDPVCEIAPNHLLGKFTIQINGTTQVVIMRFGKRWYSEAVLEVNSFVNMGRLSPGEHAADRIESLPSKGFAVEPLPVGELVYFTA